MRPRCTSIDPRQSSTVDDRAGRTNPGDDPKEPTVPTSAHDEKGKGCAQPRTSMCNHRGSFRSCVRGRWSRTGRPRRRACLSDPGDSLRGQRARRSGACLRDSDRTVTCSDDDRIRRSRQPSGMFDDGRTCSRQDFLPQHHYRGQWVGHCQALRVSHRPDADQRCCAHRIGPNRVDNAGSRITVRAGSRPAVDPRYRDLPRAVAILWSLYSVDTGARSRDPGRSFVSVLRDRSSVGALQYFTPRPDR